MHKFSIKKGALNFKYAFQGLKTLLKEEPNFLIHLLAVLVAIIAGILLKLPPIEWITIIFAIGLVLSLDIINTSIENLADFYTSEKKEKIKKRKDLAAAGVLPGVFTALTIGVIAFIPKILQLFN